MHIHVIKNHDDVNFLTVYWCTYDCDSLTTKDIEKELSDIGIHYYCGSPYALLHKNNMWYIGFEDDGCIKFFKDKCYHEDWHKFFVKTVRSTK